MGGTHGWSSPAMTPIAEGAPTMTSPPPSRWPSTPAGRPDSLPLAHLLRLSVYWLGLIAVVDGHRGRSSRSGIKDLVPDPTIQYTTLGIIQGAGVIIAVLVQPIVGSISDYTISRFGRRKPYILIGTLLDVVFLVGIATSNTVLAVGAFVVLLQFSANFAQGPFQGYVPDLVPAIQVGLASGLVGLFTVLGRRRRHGPRVDRPRDRRLHDPDDRARHHRARHDAVAVLPARRGTGGEGPRRPKLDGRSPWRPGARDVLKERSFMFLVASRFFVLGGGDFLIGLLVPYLERSLRDHRPASERAEPASSRRPSSWRSCTADRDHPGGEDRRPRRPQARDLRGVPDRAASA